MKTLCFLILTCFTTLTLLISRCNSFYYNGNELYKRKAVNYEDIEDVPENGVNTGDDDWQSVLLDKITSIRSDVDVLNDRQREERHGQCVKHHHCKNGDYCSNFFCHPMRCHGKRRRQLDDDVDDLTDLQLDVIQDQDVHRSRHFSRIKRSCGTHSHCGDERRCSCSQYCEDIG